MQQGCGNEIGTRWARRGLAGLGVAGLGVARQGKAMFLQGCMT